MADSVRLVCGTVRDCRRLRRRHQSGRRRVPARCLGVRRSGQGAGPSDRSQHAGWLGQLDAAHHQGRHGRSGSGCGLCVALQQPCCVRRGVHYDGRSCGGDGSRYEHRRRASGQHGRW